MSTNQPAPSTIDDYIAAFPDDVQAILEQIRATIREAAPDAQETISYKIPTFTLNAVCSSICEPTRICLSARTLVQ